MERETRRVGRVPAGSVVSFTRVCCTLLAITSAPPGSGVTGSADFHCLYFETLVEMKSSAGARAAAPQWRESSKHSVTNCSHVTRGEKHPAGLQQMIHFMTDCLAYNMSSVMENVRHKLRESSCNSLFVCLFCSVQNSKASFTGQVGAATVFIPRVMRSVPGLVLVNKCLVAAERMNVTDLGLFMLTHLPCPPTDRSRLLPESDGGIGSKE